MKLRRINFVKTLIPPRHDHLSVSLESIDDRGDGVRHLNKSAVKSVGRVTGRRRLRTPDISHEVGVDLNIHPGAIAS
jgi:hypothetical protein